MPTKLDPMTEHLFQAWSRAHGVQDQDSPQNSFDYRGLYQSSGGHIYPGHAIRQMAADHNAAANQKDTGASIENPDPFAAAAEIHGNNLKAQGDQAKEANKILLRREELKHKLLIEHMKLEHKTQESNLDRQHQAHVDEQNAQRDMAQHQMDRQAQVQDMHQQHQFSMQDAQHQRANEVQDAQAERAHAQEDAMTQRAQSVQDTHQQNHFEMQKASMKTSPLEEQLISRHAGPTDSPR